MGHRKGRMGCPTRFNCAQAPSISCIVSPRKDCGFPHSKRRNLSHSTDFEVHRNWLAITHSLPISKWYYDVSFWNACIYLVLHSSCTLIWQTTSEWSAIPICIFLSFSLEVKKFLSIGLSALLCLLWEVALNTGIFRGQQNRRPEQSQLWRLVCYRLPADNSYPYGIGSWRRAYQVGLPIVLGILSHFLGNRFTRRAIDPPTQRIISASIFLHPGFLIVDHIHFQYNGLLFGILLWSIFMTLHVRPISRAQSSASKLTTFRVINWPVASSSLFYSISSIFTCILRYAFLISNQINF